MIIKCKMCGGDLTIEEGRTVAECEYCGSRQTVPTADNEKKMTLFARANRLRAACEFDKAAGVYESIVTEFPEEAEAYWGLVLCRYGIEYVDDPATGRRIPTCHRSSFDSVLEDQDFEQACENADAIARKVYREEARQIEEIRRGIIEVSGKEAPYDIFICYKETDKQGNRTIDSVLAQDVYDALTEKGYRVFFARITLEDKLGQEYEPYIFAALNSAKLMLVFGTDYEYFNAVWVKNEWSRYLKLMAQDKTRHLIPCYKGVDAYDMPREFARLQAQDMGKLGWLQDLIRGVTKLLAREPVLAPPVTSIPADGSGNIQNLLKRVKVFLREQDWARAAEYIDRILDMDIECAEAHIDGILLKCRCSSLEDIMNRPYMIDACSEYRNACETATAQQKAELEAINASCMKAVQICHLIAALNEVAEQKAVREAEYDAACRQASPLLACAAFYDIAPYRDSAARAEECARQCNEERLAAALARARAAREARTNACSARLATLEHDLQEARNNISSSNDRIASLTETEASLRGRIGSLEQELSQIRGLFSGGKKQKVQGSIDAAKGELLKTQQQLDTLHQMMESTRKQEAELTEEMALRRKELDALATSSDAENVHVQPLTVGETARNALKLFYTQQYWQGAGAIAAGFSDTVILKRDGKVVVVASGLKDPFDVSRWDHIVAVAAAGYHTVGLKQDGTVVTAGESLYQQCDANAWHDIVSIATGGEHMVGLRQDGTVVAVGKYAMGQCKVSDWRHITAIAAGYAHTVGVKRDGTVVAVGNNNRGQRDVSLWCDVVAVAAGTYHTVGLKRDGTVVAVGSNQEGQCNVSDWTDIVAVAAGNSHTVGLKRDGTVVAVGDHHYGQCAVSSWSSIAAIAAGYDQTVGFMRDGTIMTTGREINIQRLGCGWSDIGGGLALD